MTKDFEGGVIISSTLILVDNSYVSQLILSVRWGLTSDEGLVD